MGIGRLLAVCLLLAFQAISLGDDETHPVLKNATILFQNGQFDDATALIQGHLELFPDDAEAHSLLGIVVSKQHGYEIGLDSLIRAFELDPIGFNAFNVAVGYTRTGNCDRAIHFSKLVIKENPGDSNSYKTFFGCFWKDHMKYLPDLEDILREVPDALSKPWVEYGRIMETQQRYEEAAAAFQAAIDRDPSNAVALAGLAWMHQQAGEKEKALELYLEALSYDPNQEHAVTNLGNLAYEMEKFDIAIPLLQKAVEKGEFHAHTVLQLVMALKQTDRKDEAIHFGEIMYERYPQDYIGNMLMSDLMFETERYDEAESYLRRAIEIAPERQRAYLNLGNQLKHVGRLEEAESAFNKSLEIRPGDVPTLWGLQSLMTQMGFPFASMYYLDQILKVDPTNELSFREKAVNLLKVVDYLDNAIPRAHRAFAQYLALHLEEEYIPTGAAGITLNTLYTRIDWKDFGLLTHIVTKRMPEGAVGDVTPFVSITFPNFSAQTRKFLAIKHQEDIKTPVLKRPLVRGPEGKLDENLRYHPERKLRVAFVGHDFFEHPVCDLLRGPVTHLDRSRFHVSVFSYGVNDTSDCFYHMVEDSDMFHNVTNHDDGEIAELIALNSIDVAIDITGFTAYLRGGVLKLHPAPLQMVYMAYAGSVGGGMVEYYIADNVSLPPELSDEFVETVVRTPYHYYVNTYPRVNFKARTEDNRAQQDLPPLPSIVLGVMHRPFKLAPSTIDVWVNICQMMPGSVLWFALGPTKGRDGMLAEVQARGLPLPRAIFIQREEDHDEHLARLSLTDVVLDPFVYNGHSSSAELLWCGVPILTMPGDHLVRRITAGMLVAHGMPELITHSMKEFEDMAVQLQGPYLEDLREKVQRHRDDYAVSHLFDTVETTDGLGRMMEREVENFATRVHAG